MKQLKELDIEGSEDQLLALIHSVSTSLPTGWRRDTEAEARFSAVAGERKDSGFAFCREAKDGDPKTGLFLASEGGKLNVTNIVPLTTGELSLVQYNGILDEFAEILCAHLPSHGEVKMRITSDQAAIIEYVSRDAADLLKHFSNLANMSTGSGHPLDRERWVRFLIQVHTEGSTLQSHFLSRWLVEELRWPPDRADDLVKDYEFARDLLRAYDRS